MLDTITSGSAKDLSPGAADYNAEPVPGEGSTNAPEPPIVLGSDLAEQSAPRSATACLITSPQGELTPFGLAPKYERFRVAGIFHSGFYQYDAAMGFMRLSDAQQLFSEPDLLSVISFKVDNLDRAPEDRRMRSSRPPATAS